jgi:hypothetical protein
MALPTLKLVEPYMKKGTLIIADNIDQSKAGYQELLEYVGKPENGFKFTSAPYSGGLGIFVYVGHDMIV